MLAEQFRLHLPLIAQGSAGRAGDGRLPYLFCLARKEEDRRPRGGNTTKIPSKPLAKSDVQKVAILSTTLFLLHIRVFRDIEEADKNCVFRFSISPCIACHRNFMESIFEDILALSAAITSSGEDSSHHLIHVHRSSSGTTRIYRANHTFTTVI